MEYYINIELCGVLLSNESYSCFVVSEFMLDGYISKGEKSFPLYVYWYEAATTSFGDENAAIARGLVWIFISKNVSFHIMSHRRSQKEYEIQMEMFDFGFSLLYGRL